MSDTSAPRPESRWGRKGALTLAALAALSTAACGGGSAAPDEQPASMPTAEEPAQGLQPIPEYGSPPFDVEPSEPTRVPAYGVSPGTAVPMYGLPADVPVQQPIPPVEGSAEPEEGSGEVLENGSPAPVERPLPMPVYGIPPR